MAAMTARMRRITSDWEQVRKDFAGHKNIIVTPVGELPPEKYHVTYFVNGIYLLPDGKIETLGRHEVEITLHAEYPRYKPICKIITPIWHPNFRDGQVCIGDIWGAGESLSDIIINIGDMIQYKSWNSYSPLSADAAQWAMENKHLFPVGSLDLHIADYASAKDEVDIDLFDDEGSVIPDDAKPEAAAPIPDTSPVPASASIFEAAPTFEAVSSAVAVAERPSGNDFEITAEDLAGIEFVPTAQRMQTVSHGGLVKGNRVNFKTVLVKGLLWALIGAFAGFGLSELAGGLTSGSTVAKMMGQHEIADYFEYSEKATNSSNKAYREYEAYCRENDLDPDISSNFSDWYSTEASSAATGYLDDYNEYDEKAGEAINEAYVNEFDSDDDSLERTLVGIVRTSTGLWAGIIALFIGLFLGIGEGIFYGSKEKAVKYAAIGAGVAAAIGFVSGYLAQWMYAAMLSDDSSAFTAAFVRGLGWALMGLGIGLAVGLIKPEKKRMLFCAAGGFAGAFIGGFLFNFVLNIIPNVVVARGVAIVLMGLLIGVGVGLLEQFAKQAWLKVIRGEFEGKEYLVFSGTTSIGNNGKNTIVLFKDKLVAPHHCDIVLEGSKYVVVDQGSPLGTVVNGMRTTRHVLKQGDAIAIGNSVLVFNTK